MLDVCCDLGCGLVSGCFGFSAFCALPGGILELWVVCGGGCLA